MDLEHERRLTDVENRTKSNTHRLDEVEKRQDNMDEIVSAVKVLAVREETVEKDVKEIKTDVKNLTNKSGQRWDNLIDKAFLVVATILITYIFSKMGIQ